MPKAGTHSIALSILATAALDKIRTEQLDGQEHSVVPLIALVEGVWQGASSEHPELALASEFGKVPEGWNGRPVTLGHPKREGSFVSAGSPSVFEKETVGMLFNTTMKDKKLKTEAWINKAKVAALGEKAAADIARLFSGEVVEVSTGLFTTLEEASGVFNGQEFCGVWRDVLPDHLAILPEGTIGACSVADGAGAPRVNQAGLRANEIRVMAKKENVMDPTEATNPDAKKAKKKKNPDATDTSTGSDVPGVTGNSGALALQRLSKDFKGQIEFKGNAALSNGDTQTAIATALAACDDCNCYWIVAVFPTFFVYCQNWDAQFYQMDYSIADTGMVTLGSTVTEVRPVTEFVPVQVTISNGGSNMTTQQKIDALMKSGRFNEADKELLATFSEEQLDKALAVKAKDKPAVNADGKPKVEGEAEGGDESADDSADAGEGDEGETAEQTATAPETMESYLNKAPKEIREVLNESVALQKTQKAKLVKDLKGNSRCEFSEDELKGMSMVQLSKLAKLAKLPNYAGNAGSGTPAVNETKDEGFTPAPKVFEAQTAAK